MKNQNTTPNREAVPQGHGASIGGRLIARYLAAVIFGVLGIAAAQTFNPQADLPHFGLVGINPDVESLLLNVSNVAIPGITAGGACDVQLSFSDVNGNVLQSIVVPQLAVGSSSSSQLVFTTPPRGRVEVLPNTARGGACVLTSSVEIVDNATSRTTIYAAYLLIPAVRTALSNLVGGTSGAATPNAYTARHLLRWSSGGPAEERRARKRFPVGEVTETDACGNVVA